MFSRKAKSKEKTPTRQENYDLLTDNQAQAVTAMRVCPMCHKPAEQSADVCSRCGSKLTGGSAWR